MNLVLLKIIFSAAVFLAGSLGVLLPWLVKKGLPGERFMTWGDTFAGGVLAGAGLIHLLSNGTDTFNHLLPGVHYPLAFVLAGAGFLLILLIEGVIAAGSNPGDSPLHCGSKGAGHEIGPRPHTTGHRPYTFILLLVLSIHSLILGTALGAQNSQVNASMIFIAILAHKTMAGFALGIGYFRTGISLRKAVPIMILFASMTPLGILAGATIATLISTGGRLLFEAIFDSLGAGTFLYIATLDIIRTEFELPGDNWQKWLLALGGFGIMALLALWI